MVKPAVKPIPDGMHSLTPHLICAGAADAIEFYKNAFNAVDVARLPGPDGKLILRPVARRPLRIPAETSIQPAWQMAATVFPELFMSLTKATIAGLRRIRSGEYPPGITTASKSLALAWSAFRSGLTG